MISIVGSAVQINKGGTGAVTSAGARINLGLEIGTDIAGLSTDNTFTGVNTFTNDNIFSGDNSFTGINTFNNNNIFSGDNSFTGINTFSNDNIFSGENSFTGINTFTNDNIFSGINTFSNTTVITSRVHYSTGLNGTNVVDKSTGILLTAAGMNATSQYTPPLSFGSTDPEFTTENPKVLAGIAGRAFEAYVDDTRGAMGLDFFVSSPAPGTNPALTRVMSLTNTGLTLDPTFSLTAQTLSLRSNIVTTTTDIALTDNANIAAGGNMNFYIDSDSNTTSAQFNWRKDAAFESGHTDLMTLSEAGTLVVTSTSAAQGTVTIHPGNPGRQIAINRTDNSVNASIEYTNTSGTVYAGHGPANSFAIGDSANLSSAVGRWLTLNNTKMGLEVGQIQFPATQSASSDANTLDDYEEGSWTPTIDSSGGGSGTYTTQTGVYTKIGRSVLVSCEIVITAHSGSGTMSIGGLPFTPDDNYAMAVDPSSLTLTANNVLVALTVGANINLRQYPVGGGGLTNAPLDSNFTLRVTGWYRTSS